MSATSTKKRICIVSFSPILRDARVLRQIEYLSPHYDLTVVGYGDSDPKWRNVVWSPVQAQGTIISRLVAAIFLLFGRLWSRIYDVWYWSRTRNRQAFQHILACKPDAIHANDLSALPLAVEAAKRVGAKVVFDAHEYAPLEFENRKWWLFLFSPMTRYFLRKYAPCVQGSMTVCTPIAERYRKEYGLDMLTVLNAPRFDGHLPAAKPVDPAHIHLIHHGGAMRDRHLEWMVETLALADQRFSLHFMLVGNAAYIGELQALSDKLAPGRVVFHDPVRPAEVVRQISQYDIGIYLLAASSYNNFVALPNKFFDFIGAGLAALIGPSPAMAEMVRQYSFGWVSPSFKPQDAAQILNGLTPQQITAMQSATRQVAQQFNADTELAKVVALYHRLLNEPVS